MSVFRDRVLVCPRCGSQLARVGERELWRCDCGGMLFADLELRTELAMIAPEIDLAIAAIDRGPHLSCPACTLEMSVIAIAGIELDRCEHDKLLWFDRGEPGAVVDHAREARHTEPPPRATFGAALRRLFGRGS